MNHYPIISIVTPTYNSAKTIQKYLLAIKKQTYPNNNIEILIVDGGSTDDTLKIATKYKCRIIHNSKTDIMEAERLGFISARGKYLIGLAPDEVLENPDSLMLKYETLKSNKNIKAVLLSGYKTPSNFHKINNYINEFGDPFSYFMYRDSKGYGYLIKDFNKKYKIVKRNRNYTVYNLSDYHPIPLIELWAGGCMIDLQYTKKHFPEIKRNPSLIPLIYYLLIKKGGLIGVTHKDPTVHYSSASIIKYLKKIRSRVEFNVYLTPMGKGGYTGREIFELPFIRLKKYLFILYSFTIILPMVDSIYLAVSRKKYIYLIHSLLCIYTSFLIVYFFTMKSLKVKHTIPLYGS